MSLEIVLILQYQTKNGILFQDIGILLTGYMAGLAAGAYVTDRVKRLLSRGSGIGLLAGFAGLCGFIGYGTGG